MGGQFEQRHPPTGVASPPGTARVGSTSAHDAVRLFGVFVVVTFLVIWGRQWRGAINWPVVQQLAPGRWKQILDPAYGPRIVRDLGINAVIITLLTLPDIICWLVTRRSSRNLAHHLSTSRLSVTWAPLQAVLLLAVLVAMAITAVVDGGFAALGWVPVIALSDPRRVALIWHRARQLVLVTVLALALYLLWNLNRERLLSRFALRGYGILFSLPTLLLAIATCILGLSTASREPEAMPRWRRWLQWLDKLPVVMVALGGNHCLRSVQRQPLRFVERGAPPGCRRPAHPRWS